MPDQNEFVNYYIEALQNEVTELTKTKVLGDAKEKYKDAELAELRNQIAALEQNTREQEDRQEIARLENLVKNKDAQIQTLTVRVDEFNRTLKDRENTIKRLTDEMARLENELKDKSETSGRRTRRKKE